MVPPELPQTLRVEAVPAGGCDMTVRADAKACAALAQRMQIPAVLEMVCRFFLQRTGGRVVAAEGWLHAAVVLNCVVTTEPFEAVLDEEFSVRFVPSGSEQAYPDPDSVDEIPYEDGILAIGDAAAEQLALALPAFPRGPDAPELVDTVFDDETPDVVVPTPFAALAARRKPV